MKASQFWSVDNVSSFKGFEVDKTGQVSVYDNDFEEHLNEIYGEVVVCGYTYGSGALLSSVDPIAFRCNKSDWESELQSELEEQLSREDSDNIEFIDGDEFELDEEGE